MMKFPGTMSSQSFNGADRRDSSPAKRSALGSCPPCLTGRRGAYQPISSSLKEQSLNDLYLIVHAVEDLSPGAYVFHREIGSLELLKQGDFRRDAGYLGLGQEIPADCSVDVFFLTDLNKVLARFGNRGYRAAQLEASIMGGKLYLAAYAQRLGASGLTFFDDDVTEFFSPHAAGKSVMFLLALGKSVKQKS